MKFISGRGFGKTIGALNLTGKEYSTAVQVALTTKTDFQHLNHIHIEKVV